MLYDDFDSDQPTIAKQEETYFRSIHRVPVSLNGVYLAANQMLSITRNLAVNRAASSFYHVRRRPSLQRGAWKLLEVEEG